MKANELMVGDIVTFKDCQNDEEVTIIKIWQINEDGDAIVSIDGDKSLDAIAIDDEIVGIPLTPEILEKNGFFRLGNQYNTWCMRSFSFSLDFIDGVFGYYEQGKPYNPTFVTKYVHELQHALKLCGIEKTIEL